MDKGQIVTVIKDLLNADTTQVHQDFTDAQILRHLNLVYQNEVNHGKLNGSMAWYLAYYDVTWPANDVTLDLPKPVCQKELFSLLNMNNDVIGSEMYTSMNGNLSTIFWKGHNTLQWGTLGPGSDQTIRFLFYANSHELVDDADEPLLMPDAYHELLAWSTAIQLRTMADEMAPQSWLMKQRELRMQHCKAISKGKIQADTPRIRLESARPGAYNDTTTTNSGYVFIV